VIRAIAADETRPLRQRVLRPHQTLEELVYPGDEASDTVHLGAFAGEVLVAIASLYHEAPRDRDDARAWRLRGMATAPEVRGGGYGGAVLEACLEHARAHGANFIWCNARVPVAGFYRRYGFRVEGDVFDLPGIGPHVHMSRILA
jgi:predicted GNAT family N-acyltransferase